MTQAQSFKKEEDVEISSVSINERMTADTQLPMTGTSQDDSGLMLKTPKHCQLEAAQTSSSE